MVEWGGDWCIQTGDAQCEFKQLLDVGGEGQNDKIDVGYYPKCVFPVTWLPAGMFCRTAFFQSAAPGGLHEAINHPSNLDTLFGLEHDSCRGRNCQ